MLVLTASVLFAFLTGYVLGIYLGFRGGRRDAYNGFILAKQRSHKASLAVFEGAK